MEYAYLGLFLCFMCLYLSSERKLKKKKAEISRLKKKMNNNGGTEMSKLISEYIGKKCKFIFSDTVIESLNQTAVCTVLECDDEWMKVQYLKKPKKADSPVITKIIRMDSIMSIEPVE